MLPSRYYELFQSFRRLWLGTLDRFEFSNFVNQVVCRNSTGLPAQLGQLYTSMSRTTDAYVPHQFLASLRQSFPQFAEFSRGGGSGIKQLMGAGYAQQGNLHPYQLPGTRSWKILKPSQMQRNVIPRSSRMPCEMSRGHPGRNLSRLI